MIHTLYSCGMAIWIGEVLILSGLQQFVVFHYLLQEAI